MYKPSGFFLPYWLRSEGTISNSKSMILASSISRSTQ